MTGELAEFSSLDALLRFAVVVVGGIAVGVVLAYAISRWIARMFNDPLSEITLTLVLAYACMVIAEGFLHVSGVMAVVTAGLWMSATGKRSISPEASGFLHRFWHLLGYIANTLIFFLVGLLIARQLGRASAWDFAIILLTYVGVMLVRAVTTFLAQPIATRLSEGVDAKDSAVITWGGLRGAVSLALALLVARNEAIDETLRNQMLLLTAGVVLLTILVNGSTMGRLLSRLGYNEAPLGEQLAHLTAKSLVLEHVQDEIAEASRSRDLRTVPWGDVQRANQVRLEELSQRIEEIRRISSAHPGRSAPPATGAACWPWSARCTGSRTPSARSVPPPSSCSVASWRGSSIASPAESSKRRSRARPPTRGSAAGSPAAAPSNGWRWSTI